MLSVEAFLLFADDEFLDPAGDSFDFLQPSSVRHAAPKRDAPPGHAPAVAHTAPQQVAVRHDDLFTIETAQARGLDADVLHRAEEIVDREKVTHDERTVERDRQ